MKIEKYLYHSFPRRKQNETCEENLNRGKEILKLMCEVGLILAPETVRWEMQTKGNKKKRFETFQRRLCFTEIKENELDVHSKTFGPITLAFDLDKLRAVGALPVIYVPQYLESSENHFSNLGVSLIYSLIHTKSLIETLNDLKEQTDATKLTESTGLKVSEEAIAHLKRYKKNDENDFIKSSIPLVHIQNLNDHINFDTIPYNHSLGALEFITNLFYPTDNKHSAEILGYYNQREWRIVKGNFKTNDTSLDKPLTKKEKQKLLKIDKQFWSKEIVFDNEKLVRHNFATKYTPYKGFDIFDIIEKIFVPSSILKYCTGLIEERVEVIPYSIE